MYASMDFATKKDFRAAVKQGLPIVCYSPVMGMPAINGMETVEGPWPMRRGTCQDGCEVEHRSRRFSAWKARVEVRDMRVVAVH